MESLAKEITNTSNTEDAIKKFNKIGSSPDQYFNDEPFPQNENGKEAQRKCSSEGGLLSCFELFVGLGRSSRGPIQSFVIS